MNIILFGIFMILLTCYLIKWHRTSAAINAEMPPFIPNKLIFGNYFDVDLKKPHISLESLGRECKDVFSMVILGQKMVVLNSYEAIASILTNKTLDCAGRPASLFIRLATSNLRDLVFSEPSFRWSWTKTTFHQYFAKMKRVHNHLSFTEVVFLDELPSKEKNQRIAFLMITNIFLFLQIF